MGIKWKWTWITSRISPHINSTHKYPVRPNNLPFMYLPSGMAHFIALFPKIRGTTTVHDLGCLWKKTSMRPTKEKDITPSTGTIQSMKSLRAKRVFWESITAHLPCYTDPRASAACHCWRPSHMTDKPSATLMAEFSNGENITSKCLWSSQHGNIQTFYAHVSWGNANILNKMLTLPGEFSWVQYRW